MKKLLTNAVLLFFLIGLSACGESTETPETQTQTQTQTPQRDLATGGQTQLESLPVEQLQQAFTTCNFADFVFYNPSFSMSQDEPASIQQILSLIASEPAKITPNCKPSGRVNFQSNGTDILVADIYMAEPCFYLVFMENEKPVYANLLMPQGVQYFNNTFQQVLDMQKQAQGQ